MSRPSNLYLKLSPILSRNKKLFESFPLNDGKPTNLNFLQNFIQSGDTDDLLVNLFQGNFRRIHTNANSQSTRCRYAIAQFRYQLKTGLVILHQRNQFTDASQRFNLTRVGSGHSIECRRHTQNATDLFDVALVLTQQSQVTNEKLINEWLQRWRACRSIASNLKTEILNWNELEMHAKLETAECVTYQIRDFVQLQMIFDDEMSAIILSIENIFATEEFNAVRLANFQIVSDVAELLVAIGNRHLFAEFRTAANHTSDARLIINADNWFIWTDPIVDRHQRRIEANDVADGENSFRWEFRFRIGNG